MNGADAMDETAEAGSGAAVSVRRWPNGPRCVPRARHHLRQEMEAWGLAPALVDTAELVVSELVTNAVRHARMPRGRLIETRLQRTGDGVRIEVHDANETRPEVHRAAEDEESGRSLALVEALTGARWGVSSREGVGKLVWAVVSPSGTRERRA
ncbi:ATP-binding protein [Streptomyces sp. HPF1205]|uniref:ATP-binding protein n=1 Tax=Streptomyces sp. HPF1205 TaxID=2873262 RepID=UPI001CEC43B9|nr:ATP-binding protein [Streptomyces sp. HPF1205]